MCFLVAGFSSHAMACRFQSPENSKETIESAAFIGLVRVLERNPPEGRHAEFAALQPPFFYKHKDEFDLRAIHKVFFDTTVLTSCDYNPQSTGSIMEVVLFQDNDGSVRMGNKSDMALGESWQSLRSAIQYIK